MLTSKVVLFEAVWRAGSLLLCPQQDPTTGKPGSWLGAVLWSVLSRARWIAALGAASSIGICVRQKPLGRGKEWQIKADRKWRQDLVREWGRDSLERVHRADCRYDEPI